MLVSIDLIKEGEFINGVKVSESGAKKSEEIIECDIVVNKNYEKSAKEILKDPKNFFALCKKSKQQYKKSLIDDVDNISTSSSSADNDEKSGDEISKESKVLEKNVGKLIKKGILNKPKISEVQSNCLNNVNVEFIETLSRAKLRLSELKK